MYNSIKKTIKTSYKAILALVFILLFLNLAIFDNASASEQPPITNGSLLDSNCIENFSKFNDTNWSFDMVNDCILAPGGDYLSMQVYWWHELNEEWTAHGYSLSTNRLETGNWPGGTRWISQDTLDSDAWHLITYQSKPFSGSDISYTDYYELYWYDNTEKTMTYSAPGPEQASDYDTSLSGIVEVKMAWRERDEITELWDLGKQLNIINRNTKYDKYRVRIQYKDEQNEWQSYGSSEIFDLPPPTFYRMQGTLNDRYYEIFYTRDDLPDNYYRFIFDLVDSSDNTYSPPYAVIHNLNETTTQITEAEFNALEDDTSSSWLPTFITNLGDNITSSLSNLFHRLSTRFTSTPPFSYIYEVKEIISEASEIEQSSQYPTFTIAVASLEFEQNVLPFETIANREDTGPIFPFIRITIMSFLWLFFVIYLFKRITGLINQKSNVR